MNEMIDFKSPTIVICHFRQDELISAKMGTRIVRYQVLIDNDNLSPGGEFMRFDSTKGSEIHGWVPVEDVIIDEVLERLEVKEAA